MQINIQVANAC